VHRDFLITLYYCSSMCIRHQDVLQEYKQYFISVRLLLCYISINIVQCADLEHTEFIVMFTGLHYSYYDVSEYSPHYTFL
jgi:hypothetical protein